MSTREFRQLQVLHKQHITPNLVRIILGGHALSSFPEDQEGGYVKLIFPPLSGAEKPRPRSYTIRQFDSKTQQLTLDFMVHGDNGPASAWALGVQVGDEISTDGPGSVKRVNTLADWFLLAGDMTALPAISVNLEQLPEHAIGYAVIEVLSEADQQMLIAPQGIDIRWVINPHPDSPNTLLLEGVKALPWLPGTPSIWVASEFDAMRHLRRYFKTECDVQRDQLYISSYWKMGETDEGNKVAKKQDAEREE